MMDNHPTSDLFEEIVFDSALEMKLIRYTDIAATFFETEVAFIAFYEPSGSLSFKSVVRNPAISVAPEDALYQFLLKDCADDCVILDMTTHHQLSQSQSGYRFFASTSIIVDEVVIGQLCILDLSPREPFDFHFKERDFLRDTAQLIAHRIKNVTAAKRVSPSSVSSPSSGGRPSRLRPSHSSSTIATDDTGLSSWSADSMLDDPVMLPVCQKQSQPHRGSYSPLTMIRRLFAVAIR